MDSPVWQRQRSCCAIVDVCHDEKQRLWQNFSDQSDCGFLFGQKQIFWSVGASGHRNRWRAAFLVPLCSERTGGRIVKNQSIVEQKLPEWQNFIPDNFVRKNNSLLKDDYFFVLNYSLKNVSFKPTDLRGVFDGKSDAQLMYIVKKMNEEGFLQKDPSSNRKYTISFNQPVLLRGIIEQLATAGFINNLQ